MGIFLTTLVTIGSLTSSLNMKLENSSSFYKLERKSVASYYDSTTWTNDNGYIQVGRKENKLSTSFIEQRYYKSYLKLDFPKLKTINKLTLTLTKHDGNCEFTNINYYLYNVDFSSHNNLASGSVGIYHNANVYTIDLTEAALMALKRNNHYFYISLERLYQDGYMEFYYKSDDETLNPSIHIETSDVPTSNTYGSASTFIRYSSIHDYRFIRNCYAHAFDFDEEDNVGEYIPEGYLDEIHNQTYSRDLLNKMANIVINDAFKNHNRSARLIDDYNSPIYEFEYRVAMRLGYNEGTLKTEHMHFLKQTNTGSWDEKYATSINNEHKNFNPTLDSWVGMDGNNYNSETIYFAASK